MKVEQMMSTNVKTCSPNDTLEIAAGIMWDHDCGIVPVVDPEGKAIGVVTDRDICMAGYTQGMQYWQIPVSIAASKKIFTIKPSDSLHKAEAVMRLHQVRRLIVVDDVGKVAGVLSINDLARKAKHAADLSDVAQTLSAICQTARHDEDGGTKTKAASA